MHRRNALTQEVYDEIRERVGRGEGPGGIWEEMRKGRGEGWLVGRRDVANAVREARMGRVRKRALRREGGDDGGGVLGGGANDDGAGGGDLDARQVVCVAFWCEFCDLADLSGSVGGVADLLNGGRWPDQGHGISVDTHANATSISLSRLEKKEPGANQAKGGECYRPGMKLFLVRFDME